MINLDSEARKYRRGEKITFLYGVAAPALATSVYVLNKLPLNSELYKLFLEIITIAAPIIYLVFLLAFLYGKWLVRKSNPIIWKALQVQIDKLQVIAFPNYAEDINDNHRVTLFKFTQKCKSKPTKEYKKRLTKNSGWLIPVIRSGHTGKDTSAKFFAPDSGNDAEGIVGKCWSSDNVQYQENLPKIIVTSGEQRKRAYCHRSNMPRSLLDEYVKNGKCLAQNILAIPLMTRTGERWGVIVFDSMEPNGVDKIQAEQSFYTVAETLGVLVEEV